MIKAKAIKFAKLALVVCTTVAALVYLLSTVELDLVASEMAAVNLTYIGLAFLGLFLTVMISCLRYHSVLVTLGVPVPFRIAANANLVGILGGSSFFNWLGRHWPGLLFWRGLGWAAVPF